MFSYFSLNFESHSWLIISGIIASIVFHFTIEPFRWVVYLKGKNNSFLVLFYIFFSTAFFSYILPFKLGVPLRFWMIKRYQKINTDIASIFMIADSAVSVLLWTMASTFLGADFVINIFIENFNKFKHLYLLLSLSLIVIVATIFFLVKVKCKDKLFRLHIVLKSIKLNQFFFITLLFISDMASYVVRHGLIIILIHGPDLDWMRIMTITILSIFAGFASAMPMGLVGYDATIIILLTQSGMGIESATAVPVINRIANIFVSVLLGVPSTFKLGLDFNINKLKKELNI